MILLLRLAVGKKPRPRCEGSADSLDCWLNFFLLLLLLLREEEEAM